MAILLAVTGLVAILYGVLAYGAAVRSGDNGRITSLVGLGLLVGVGLTAAALAIGGAGARTVVLVLAGVNGFTTVLLLTLHALRRVPTDGITVAVGEPLPRFEALTPEGTNWDSTSLAGRRVLLKFFRGEWCPFCQAELQRFDAMRPELEARGVEVIAISKDTPEAARRHRARDGLALALLCDPDLTVIRCFGLEHRKALEISAGPRIRVFGLAVGTRPAFRAMAAPTSILVDESGTIEWIDQTDDYKVRSNPDRVLQAIDGMAPPVVAPARSVERAPIRCGAST